MITPREIGHALAARSGMFGCRDGVHGASCDDNTRAIELARAEGLVLGWRARGQWTREPEALMNATAQLGVSAAVRARTATELEGES